MKIGKLFIVLMFIGTMFFLSSCEETTEPEASATLIVNSTPQGATIILDGEPVRAVTPATLEIESGYHELRLELTGYQDYFVTFTVDEGDTYNIDAILEVAYDTSLQISSVPAGASIYIDGTYTGLFTPATIDGLVPGYHFVRLYLAGYNEYNVYFNLVEGTPYVVNANLGTPQPPLPVFDISYPSDQQHFTDNVIYLQADVELDNGDPFTGNTAIITLNGFDYEIDVYSGYIYVDISIAADENTIQLRANSANGDTGVSDVITVYGDFAAPEIEVVLWWNTSTSDLDLHAWNPLGEHCHWLNMIISDGSLDIDDVDGYGPETFTVQTAYVGIYEIQINCYSLHEDNYADATVQVFIDGELEDTCGPHHFIVDDGMGNDPLAWWEVCTITVYRGKASITNEPLSPEMRDKIMYDKMNLPRK
ncbi:MAG: PEGA domain-containing protein [Candidatus Cloacimonetes bacterium]|nr:PEGA domain-containing protein [Candidatus Cloacimonadota bacterium]